jgi:protein O-GlcNAc transferase
VTLAGSVHAGRVGVSILSSAGLAEMVAKDEEQYVTIAVTLARDVERLRELRHGMREKLAASALFDERRLAREIERGYRNMWKGWCG